MKRIFVSLILFLSVIACSDKSTGPDDEAYVYQTVQIGDQVWMAENLRETRYRNGDAIPKIMDETKWFDLATGAYCTYDNKNSNADTYGMLYNWMALNDPRGLAPVGWHIPSKDEWLMLGEYLGEGWQTYNEVFPIDSIVGGKMKTTGTEYWSSPNTGATNESGFSALPGGFRSVWGPFYYINEEAGFWSSTDNDGTYVWGPVLRFNNSSLRMSLPNKRNGISVRCIKDN